MWVPGDSFVVRAYLQHGDLPRIRSLRQSLRSLLQAKNHNFVEITGVLNEYISGWFKILEHLLIWFLGGVTSSINLSWKLSPVSFLLLFSQSYYVTFPGCIPPYNHFCPLKPFSPAFYKDKWHGYQRTTHPAVTFFLFNNFSETAVATGSHKKMARV